MFRPMHIRTKLGVALAVPLVGLVAMAGFEVVSARSDATATRSETALVTASVGPGTLITRLQNERSSALLELLGLRDVAGPPGASSAELRGLVDAAATQLRAGLRGHGAELTDAFAPVWDATATLDELRADIDSSRGARGSSTYELANQVFSRYTAIVEPVLDASGIIVNQVGDATLRRGTDIVDASLRQNEVQARIGHGLLVATVTGTTSSPSVGQDLAALRGRGHVLEGEIRASASGPFLGIADATFADASVQRLGSLVDGFLAGRPVAVADIVSVATTEPGVGYLGLASRASEALAGQVDQIERDALARQQLFGGLALGALLVTMFLTWLATRSVTRPLASLRRQAEEMAGIRLPAAVRQILDTAPGEDVVIPVMEPIAVRSHDEVAEVAAALNAVQVNALDLAVEQAVLRRNISDSYINLGRRNQNLLSRQLDFITELERNETDPDTLEGLFRLDHLATRMRRNAESLLVLAGVEAPRQWSAPVKMADVVRAALGEVEDYQRVVIHHLEPAALSGAVAAAIAHVTAELIENGLSFSPQDHQVEVKGRLTVDGYTLAISDNGYGMPPDELDRANRRLAGAESFTVAPSRYLGHYVVGHLATRLGVVVELHSSPAGGVTARVDVPMGLLEDEETDPRLVALSVLSAASAPTAEPVAEPVAEPIPPVAPVVRLDEEPSPGATPCVEAESGGAPSFTLSGLPRRGDRPVESSEVPAEVQVAPVAEVAPDEPASTNGTEEASPVFQAGFGGLAITRPTGPSLYSVAAQNARSGAGSPTTRAPRPEADTTITGLPRRVPGAQRPDAAFDPVRSTDASPTVGAERSSAEDVYSFLSNFQSGVARGRADADAEFETPESDR